MLIAVLDACVLYPPSLRDLFLWLAAGIVFQPRWTDDIHIEWTRNVLADNPNVTAEQLQRTRRLMDQVNNESLVTGYQAHIPSLTLPDPNDRHVLAAAIQACASIIVTFNLSDFPAAILRTYRVRAMHPDDYLIELLNAAPELFLTSVRNHRASLKRPPKSVEDYIETLAANRLNKLALRLAAHQEDI